MTYHLKLTVYTRIVNLNKIGEHFGVSYATVRRRLQADQLFPIDLKKIDNIGRFFFIVKTVGADGVSEVSADPLRSAIFNGGLFLMILLLGGLWAFRTMARAEIAVSAAIISAIYLFLTLMQLYLPNFPVSISVELATFQNWIGILASSLYKITGRFNLSVLSANFAPFLFVPFGRKTIHTSN